MSSGLKTWRRTAQRLKARWFKEAVASNISAEIGAWFGDSALSNSLLPLLGMGRDTPDGRMFLREGLLEVDWTTANSSIYFNRVRATMRDISQALGATFLDDPVWYLSQVITVHALGGCAMGRTIEEGVVSTSGEVYNYPGLYIADGSVMPGPVGANPSLTIAALADRFADTLIAQNKRSAPA